MEIELDIIKGIISIVLIKADIASNMIDFQCESLADCEYFGVF